MTDDKLAWPIRENHEGKSYEERDFPLGMWAFALFGGPRCYMGLENFSYQIYDDISLIDDMFETQVNLSIYLMK